jgi:hypothetical protein
VNAKPQLTQSEYVLAALRSAAARARCLANDIDFIGVSLQHRMIDPDQAPAMPKLLSDPRFVDVPIIGLSATPWPRGLGRYFDRLIIGATARALIETAHQFKQRFGHFPPWSYNDLEPSTPSFTARNWVRSRQIAYAKARRRAAS